MAGELTTIRDGIETRLKTISGLQVYDHEPTPISGVTPAATIKLESMTQSETFKGASVPGDRTYRWTVTLRLAGAIPQEMWQSMDDYLAPTGSKSILAAIDGDDTLGGAVDWTVMTPGESIDVTDRESRADGWYYVQEFPLETYKSG